MAISSDILVTICAMSGQNDRGQGERGRKNRDEDWAAGPTAERMAKPDYYGAAGQRRKCRVLESLRGSGDLGSESEAIAERWVADYQYARFGYADFMREPLPDSYVKGDAITFGLGRAKGGQRIAMIREALGAEAHDFLVRLLIDEHAFTEIARDMVPHIKGTAGGKAVRQRAVMLLQMLPRFYRAALLAQKKEASGLAGMTGPQKP